MTQKAPTPNVGDKVITTEFGEITIIRRFMAPDGDWILHTADTQGVERRLTMAQLEELKPKPLIHRGRVRAWLKNRFGKK